MAAVASAQPVTRYQFCIQGDDNPGWTGCAFDTLQACQATASGTGDECLSNPWYKPGNDGPSTPDSSPNVASGPMGIGSPPNSET